MAYVALFHSVYGRRPAILAAAGRLRSAGHTVTAPDLYDGPVAATAGEGFALCERIGWPAVMDRARQALTELPAETVLFGQSMGAAVAAGLLAERPLTPALLLWHNTGGGDAETVRPGLRLQLHIADPDVYESATQVADWERHMAGAGAAVRAFHYPGSGHLFTDPGTPDYDGPAADLTWQRSLSFLSGL